MTMAKRTVYVTRFWPEEGLVVKQAVITTSMVSHSQYASFFHHGAPYCLRLQEDAFFSKDAADRTIAKQAAKKIASLRQQLTRLERLYPQGDQP